MRVPLAGGRRPRPTLSLMVLFTLLLSLMLPLTASAQFKDDDQLPSGEYEDVGLVADGEYESPQFGYTVEWSTAWDLDPYYDPPVSSDEDEERDDIKLAWFGDDGEEAYLNVIGSSDPAPVEDDLAYLADPDNAAAFWGEGIEPVVLLDDVGRDSGAVLFALVEGPDAGQPAESDPDVYLSLFVVVQLEDGAKLTMTLSSDVAVYAGAYDMAEAVLINGEPMLNQFDADDVQVAVDDAMALSSPDSATDAELEELGLVGEGEYESPQFGYAVEWSTEWALDEYYAVPLVSDTDAGVDEVYLEWTGERADPDETAYAMVSGQANGEGVDETLERWTGDEYAERWGEHVDANVIIEANDGDTGVVLFSLYREDTERQYYKINVVVEREGGEVLYLTLNTWEPDFEAAYAAAGGILVDGEPLLTLTDWDEIEEAIEEAA
jgi:hypothetical protein